MEKDQPADPAHEKRTLLVGAALWFLDQVSELDTYVIGIDGRLTLKLLRWCTSRRT